MAIFGDFVVWFKRAGIRVTPGPFTGSSMGPASDGRLKCRFPSPLVSQFLAALTDPPCLRAAVLFPRSTAPTRTGSTSRPIL